MQYHERVGLPGFAECLVETSTLAFIESTTDLTLLLRVEQDDPPRADIVVTTDMEGRCIEDVDHRLRDIVVTGDAEDGNLRIERFVQPLVAAWIVVNDIARQQNEIGAFTQGLGQHGSQRVEHDEAALTTGRVAHEMRIGDLEDADGGHGVNANAMIAPVSEAAKHGNRFSSGRSQVYTDPAWPRRCSEPAGR